LFRRKSIIERWLDNEPPAAPHLWVAGGTGMGKTSLVKRLSLRALERGEKVFIIDYDGEYVDLPLSIIRPPFDINADFDTVAWLLSQAARPEDGGHAVEVHFQRLFEKYSTLSPELRFTELIKLAEVEGLPYNIRQAIQWRLYLFNKYFRLSNASPVPDGAGAIYDLSPVRGGRAKETVQEILLTYSLFFGLTTRSFIVVEESSTGSFLRDILIEARRKGLRIIAASQRLPDSELLTNFEYIIFTPFYEKINLPLPINPATDRGAWWVGRLGTRRLSLNI
jgi:DNA helicase HerA-like ATPase